MNVLFDDGRYIDRRLKYVDENPSADGTELGRYDPHSEAFQFYKYVDNIWGDFQTRDLEERNHANDYARKQAEIEEITLTEHPEKYEANRDNGKIYFKGYYFLKQIPFIHHENHDQSNPILPKGIDLNNFDWQNLTVIDIVKLLPKKILNQEPVIGVAFNIYKRDFFNELNGRVFNREKTTSYYLSVRLVTDGRKIKLPKNDTGNPHNDIIAVKIDDIIRERWNQREDLIPPENDFKSLYRLAPTLVLNKETLLKNRNYNGDWDNYQGGRSFVIPENRRLVIRIGQRDNKYILFLHGDKEANCPIRIPQD
jgi:hypothetical protein